MAKTKWTNCKQVWWKIAVTDNGSNRGGKKQVDIAFFNNIKCSAIDLVACKMEF